MKKHYIVVVGTLATISLFAAAPMEERDVTLEITKVESQATNVAPTFAKKIGTFESAKNWLQQKTNCLLLDAETCSKTDLLVTNYALGFAVGATLPIQYVAQILMRSGKVQKVWALNTAQLIVELILPALGIKGRATQPLINGISNVLLSGLIYFADAIGLVHLAGQAPSRLAFVKFLGKYISLNAKCIWSESYCLPSLNSELNLSEGIVFSPFARRQILFYWLGFASGMAARRIPFGKIIRKTGEKIHIPTSVVPTFIPAPETF